MIDRIKLLPYWCITNRGPAFYDTESANAIEQTAKIYGAMRELQEDYNKFAKEVNVCITDFINNVNADQEEFECRMTKVIHDYLDYLDTKVKNQDKIIADAVAYMKENIFQSITEIIGQMKDSGELDEAVLNAIDGIGTRVATLETTMEEQTTKSNDLETRVISLETNYLITNYDEENKKLTFVISNERSE